METNLDQWNFLADTYWYVPTQSLLAMQMEPTGTAPVAVLDQTVWQITGSKDGYFWGNCAAMLFSSGEASNATPNSFRLLGSVLSNGSVLISFMPMVKVGGTLSTTGFGSLGQKDKAWYFEMQMSTGNSTMTAHRAFMLPTQSGEPSWERLPGTPYSVPELLALAGFSV